MYECGNRKCVNLTVIVAVILGTTVSMAEGYKQVVFMHGIFAGPSEFDYFTGLIQQLHPGTHVTAINLFSGIRSLTNLPKQVASITNLIMPILTNRSSEGTILVCYSQGGVVCRGLLSIVQHNVETFISLSSPIAGQFGDSVYLNFLFPNYIKDTIYQFFYTDLGQLSSVANYWNDPHHQHLYKKFSKLLAVLNNETTQDNIFSFVYRENFMRLKNLVLVGGPDDGVITPWQSSQFGMYNSMEVVLPMEEQTKNREGLAPKAVVGFSERITADKHQLPGHPDWFQNDAFGLKTLNSRKGIHKYTIPGIPHVKWHSERQVFDTCILPWLT